MAYHGGYDGGDSEQHLIAALKDAMRVEELDTVNKIKTVYWRIGHIIEIADERGYFDQLGFKEWITVNIGRGETHCRECRTCWGDRTIFDRAYEWWSKGNTGFVPNKMSGPRFSNEICKAFSERLMSDADKLTHRARGKSLNAKALRGLLAVYRSGFSQLRGEILRWGEQHGRESRVLRVVEDEIRAAEGDEEPVALLSGEHEVEDEVEDEATPAHANDNVAEDNHVPAERQHLGGEEEIDVVRITEQHLGVDFPEVQAALVRERRQLDHYLPTSTPTHPGVVVGDGFVMVDDVVPPDRTPQPKKALLRLAAPTESLEVLTDAEGIWRRLGADETVPEGSRFRADMTNTDERWLLVTPARIAQTPVETAIRKRGWPQGRKRGPKKPNHQSAQQRED